MKELLTESPDALWKVVQTVGQELLEAEMFEAIGAGRSERTEGRLGYRSGHGTRPLVTRVGKLELRVLQNRDGRFSTELFERNQRSEQALVGDAGGKVRSGRVHPEGPGDHQRTVRPQLLGFNHFDDQQAPGRKVGSVLPIGRCLSPFPLILHARYEKVREAGIVTSQAVLIAIGMDWDGRRQVLAVEMANRESRSFWKDLLLSLRERGLHGVEFVAADNHAGLRAAIREVLSGAAYQRCPVYFLRNALDHLPRKADNNCLQELRWLFDRRNAEEAQRDLAAWIGKWSGRYPKLVNWVEETMEETLTFHQLPRRHHKHLKSTNMLQRLNKESKRRTFVVRIFPNSDACLRLVRALAIETHENWLEANRYINMDDLRELKKTTLRQAA